MSDGRNVLMVGHAVPGVVGFGELCGIAADLNGDALDSGCHVDDHLLFGIRKALLSLT